MSILHRKDLVDLLAYHLEPLASNRTLPTRLILLCAPAGYGKTTLLIDTVHQKTLACCWYFFESTDTPVTFLEGLLASTQQCFPELAEQLDAFEKLDEHASTEEDCQRVLDQLVALLNSQISQKFVVALCHYHKIKQNETLNHFINHLLARPLQQGVLVIESRSLPNLNLAPLIARQQMFGIGSNKLRFTAQELYELAHIKGFTTFTLQESEHLTNLFEGWIAGILLGSILGYTQMQPLAPSPTDQWGMLAQLTDRQQLSTYIANEVFEQETATYEFLASVSVLNELTPALCNALLGRSDAAERLIYAEQQGLFVMRSEHPMEKDSVGVYICHPVLRKLLEEKLLSQSLDLYIELHRKAAYLLYDEQAYEQALIHALQAQEYRLVSSIIVQIAPDFEAQGKGETVDLWLGMLPEQVLNQDPWLLMTVVNIRLAHNEYAQVPSLLETVETLLADPASQNPDTALLLQAELRLARSKFLFYQGDFQGSCDLCQEVLQLVPASEVHLHIRAYHRLGVCMVAGLGHIYEGIVQFQHALQLSMSQSDEQQSATLHRLLASAYGWLGNYELATYHQDRAIHIWEKLHEPSGLINSLVSQGLLNLRQGLTQQAEEVLLRALYLAREVNHFRSGEAYVLVALGELYCTLAQYVRALTYLDDSLRLATQCEDHYLMHCALCSIATTYIYMGEIQTGQFFLDQVVLQPQEDRSFEGLFRLVTQGRLFLAQQAYEESQQELERAVALGEATSIQFLHEQALLLLTVCYARQSKMSDALLIASKALELNKNGDFDYTLEIESRYHPELSELLTQTVPDEPVENPPQASQAFQVSPDEAPVADLRDVPTPLRIQAFGEPKVLVNGVPITRWRMVRSQELFFLLLESTHPLSKDQLIEALWPEAMGEQLDTTMRTAIYYLRQAIGKTCVVYVSGLYSLNLASVYGSDIWYDVTQFESCYKQAKQALAAEDDEAARVALIELVELYTGDYLQYRYHDWCLPRRQRLRLAYMDALEHLAQVAWRQEDWDESIEYWNALLSLDPYIEKAHYWIMRAYLKQEKREFALRQYHICRKYLQEDLHTVPGVLLKELYQEIK